MVNFLNGIWNWMASINDQTMLIILTLMVVILFTFVWIVLSTLDRDNAYLEEIIEKLMDERQEDMADGERNKKGVS